MQRDENVRILKIAAVHGRRSGTATPRLNLAGKWLPEWGFQPGDHASLFTATGMVVIVAKSSPYYAWATAFARELSSRKVQNATINKTPSVHFDGGALEAAQCKAGMHVAVYRMRPGVACVLPGELWRRAAAERNGGAA